MRVFSERSRKNLQGVHPDLVRCCEQALQTSAVDFTVVEGLRSMERQEELLAQGYSQTLKSYHLKQADGFGHAVDLYPFFNGKVQVSAAEARWREIAMSMKEAALDLGIRITWGGDWRKFVDMPHYQLEQGQ